MTQLRLPDSTRRRSAVLELGSTSIKFYVLPAEGDGTADGGAEHKVPWELGYDVFGHGRISPRTISHCLRTLEAFRSEYPDVSFEGVTAVGTAALREAQNVEVLQRVLLERLGIQMQIIAGGIEAFLLEVGFRDRVKTFPTGLFDLGGGSLELIEYLSPSSTRKTSVPIGAIRLHCRLRRTRDLFEYIREGREYAVRTLREHIVGEPPVYPTLIGTGGTVRAIAECVGQDKFGREETDRLLESEVHGPVRAELAPHRRRVLLPGLLAVQALFTVLGVRTILHRKASVKRGLVSFTRALPSLA